MFKSKKLVTLLVFMLGLSLMAFTITACTSSEQPKQPNQEENKETNKDNQAGKKPETLKIGMATDVGGVNDESFNASAWRGLTWANEQLENVEVKYLESNSEADYVTNLNTFVRGNYDLVWGIGYAMADAIKKVAEQNPDSKFGIVDFAYVDDKGNNITPDNVVAINFREEQGSFLVGVLAGLTTKSDKIGFIGGVEMDLIKKFEYGFKAGVKTVNPDAEILTGYANSFTDSAAGKTIANSMYDQGADVIYHAAGGVGKGLMEAAKERGKGFWAIGVDSDQYKLAPNNVLASMMKRVDVAVLDVAKKLRDGEFNGGKIVVYGLKEDGVGISKTAEKNTSPKALEKAEEFKKKIITGEITVPKTEAEYNDYLANLNK